MSEEKRITTTYIPQKLYEKTRVFAARKQLSISQVMTEALESHIQPESRKNTKTKSEKTTS